MAKNNKAFFKVKAGLSFDNSSGKADHFNADQSLVIRLLVAVVFGAVLGWLSDDMKALSAKSITIETWKSVLMTTLGLGAFVLWAGAGAMRRLSLMLWGLVALGLIAFIAWHNQTHLTDGYRNEYFSIAESFLIFPFLFITHELISSADQSRKPIAPYGLYFDQAWKRGVQLALAILFTLLFWAILWLGAALLGFIGFTWFKTMLENTYFAWIATGIALAVSVNLGDVNSKLLSGVRALVLGVLSWLLPVLSVIALIFAVSLAFSGLQPLWNTKAATVTLLSACIALVLLINAAYQQGTDERPVHIIMRWTARLACGLLLVFSVLAAYSLWLRIVQYGLTPDRVLAGVGVIVALLFGISYSLSALIPAPWLKKIEGVNVALAIVKSVLFLAVLTPLADPSRLSVESQVARLNSGKVSIDKFDTKFLRFESGIYGRDALVKLTKSADPAIKAAAVKALAYKYEDRWRMPQTQEEEGRVPDLKVITIVYPKGANLPDSFLKQKFSQVGDYTPSCLHSDKPKLCHAAIIDLNGDKVQELMFLEGKTLTYLNLGKNGWSESNFFAANQELDEDAVKAFQAGEIKPVRAEYDDVMIGQTRSSLKSYSRNGW